MNRNDIIRYIAIGILLVIIVYLVSLVAVLVFGLLYGETMIENEVKNMMSELNDNDTKIITILDWVHMNINYTAGGLFISKYPFLNLRMESNIYWIYLTGFGGCGERASISKYMTEKAGIEARKVLNSGENHAWTEVFTNETWTHADPGLPYNDPDYYERQKAKGGWEKNISYVYWVDENESRHEVTRRYTDVGTLIVRVVDHNEMPVEGARVIIKSHSLMSPLFNYSKPLDALIDETNNFGTFKVELGGNNYTVVGEKDLVPFIAFSGEGNCTLSEGSICEVEVELSNSVSLTEGFFIICRDILPITLLLIFIIWRLIRYLSHK